MKVYLYHDTRNKIMIINSQENAILLSANERLIDKFRSKTHNDFVISVSWEKAEEIYKSSINDKTNIMII